MRELLFRGQTRRKGEKVYVGTGKPVESDWVYGGVFQGKGDFSIIYTYKPIEKCVVYSDTVGQYTGLTDKNGKKIFEGDIVRGTITSAWKKDLICCEIIYKNDCFLAIEKNSYGLWEHKVRFAKDIEVIGNIHDNPELLEVE